MKKILLGQAFTVSLLTVLLSACNGFFEKDNTPTPTPLTSFQAEVHPVQLWSAKTGSGSEDENLTMPPAVGENAIYTANFNGGVTAIDSATGQKRWETNTKLQLTSGPGVGDGIVVVASRKGDIAAIREQDGTHLWRMDVSDEIIAQPAIRQGKVIIKAVDGHVHALSVKDGHIIWSYIQNEPSLILRGASTPLVVGNDIIVGFATGNLVKLSLGGGHVIWQQPIATPEGAFAIERMIDIDANPIVYNHNLYAATYQGKISSVGFSSGDILWSHDISSYTGMVADDNAVFITDAKGMVWAFGADSGDVNWRQTKLEARVLSGPATMGNYIVVGDGEGYLHWLNKRDGHFAARESLGTAIKAAPIVKNNVLYALTSKGYLVAYTLH